MHVTGGWALAGAIVTGLIIGDVLFNWRGSNKLLATGGGVAVKESRLLAGRG